MKPPWVVWPKGDPTRIDGCGWTELHWLPFWRRLFPDERRAYVERWSPPEWWRDLLVGRWFSLSAGEGQANTEPLHWPVWYTGGPWSDQAMGPRELAPWQKLLEGLVEFPDPAAKSKERACAELNRASAELIRHVERRSEATRAAWASSSARAEMAEVVCETLRQCTQWPSSHFIPDDPTEIVAGIEPRHPTACQALATRLRPAITPAEVEALMHGTLGELVDGLLARGMSPLEFDDW